MSQQNLAEHSSSKNQVEYLPLSIMEKAWI